jgi:hypothetical protein
MALVDLARTSLGVLGFVRLGRVAALDLVWKVSTQHDLDAAKIIVYLSEAVGNTGCLGFWRVFVT